MLRLREGSLHLVRPGLVLAPVQFFVQSAQAFAHAIDFAGVTAEQIVAQVEPVLHHLEAHRVGGVRQLERSRGCCFGIVLAVHGIPIDDEQKDHRRQDDSKTHIQLLADCHAISPPRIGGSTPASTLNRLIPWFPPPPPYKAPYSPPSSPRLPAP